MTVNSLVGILRPRLSSPGLTRRSREPRRHRGASWIAGSSPAMTREGSPRTPMPRSAAATRARILETAYELFYRQGFARVGVDRIAASAGITKRTLYAHFES